jgi:hypothetical protein
MVFFVASSNSFEVILELLQLWATHIFQREHAGHCYAVIDHSLAVLEPIAKETITSCGARAVAHNEQADAGIEPAKHERRQTCGNETNSLVAG